MVRINPRSSTYFNLNFLFCRGGFSITHHQKKIFIIGALGTIGRILTDGLKDQYHLVLADIKNHPHELNNLPYIQTDIRNYAQLVKNIPKETDVMINLVALPHKTDMVDIPIMDQMTEIYLKGSYHILMAAAELGIKKVIFASTNHVTDVYEVNGDSLFHREITTADYPYSRGVYGVLKLASENLGYAFSLHYELAVINLRIGSVVKNEQKAIKKNPRFKKTILSKVDMIHLFERSIESDVKFGTYYGVSDNPGKPWSIKNAMDELQYDPSVNSEHLFKKGKS